MRSIDRADRVLALATVALTLLWALTALSFPVPTRKLPPAAMLTIAALALGHAIAYWHSERVQARVRLVGYVALQLALVFGIAISGAIFPFGLALLIAFTARTVSDRNLAIGAVVTVASFGTFLLAAIVTSDMYRGATSGLLLAATGVVVYAIKLAVAHRPIATNAPVAEASSAPLSPVVTNGRAMVLTSRELEVLRAVAAGSRTSEVADAMGISERTVKSHLTATYQKLGVENRAAAITVAMRANLL